MQCSTRNLNFIHMHKLKEKPKFTIKKKKKHKNTHKFIQTGSKTKFFSPKTHQNQHRPTEIPSIRSNYGMKTKNQNSNAVTWINRIVFRIKKRVRDREIEITMAIDLMQILRSTSNVEESVATEEGKQNRSTFRLRLIYGFYSNYWCDLII